MSYADYETQMTHPCDRGAFVSARGTLKDALVALTVSAIKANFLSTAPPDGLALFGAERNLERYAGEDRENYRSRLSKVWDLWTWSGTAYGIALALGGLGLTSIYVPDAYEWDPTSANWARFWVVLGGGLFPIGPDGSWGDAGVWDDGGLWDGDGDPVLKNAVLATIKKFKAAHAALVEVIIPVNHCRVWGGGWTWGDGSVWGDSAFRWKP